MSDSRVILVSQEAGEIELKAADLLAARVGSRTGYRPEISKGFDSKDGTNGVIIGRTSSEQMNKILANRGIDLPGNLDSDGFVISIDDSGAILAAHTPAGLIAGVGKLLRESSFIDGNWQLPEDGSRVFEPEKELRPIYFATHFGNWYCHASDEELERYLEDLALWGYNALVTWFDFHHYRDFEDGSAVWDRLAKLDTLARQVGLKVGRIGIINESFEGQAQPELRARGRLEGTGYETDLCPSRPEARAMILADRRAFLERIRDTTKLDWLCLWPYDQGGCNCELCTPWPTTYMQLGKEVAELTRQILPDTEIQVSAWWIGTHVRGEDDPFFESLNKREGWFKTIVVGTVELRRWLRDGRSIPDAYQVLLFPEISMFDALPWGSRGGNPAPLRFTSEMTELGSYIAGAMPYSEGRYEDINKALWAQLQWDSSRPPEEILKEYCRFEFGPEVAAEAAELIFDIEAGTRDLETAEQRYERAQKIEASMPPWGRKSWRWEVLRARAAIDALRWRLDSPEVSSEEKERIASELRHIYNDLQHRLYLHDQDRSLTNWIYSPFDVWLTLPLNELVLPTGV